MPITQSPIYLPQSSPAFQGFTAAVKWNLAPIAEKGFSKTYSLLRGLNYANNFALVGNSQYYLLSAKERLPEYWGVQYCDWIVDYHNAWICGLVGPYVTIGTLGSIPTQAYPTMDQIRNYIETGDINRNITTRKECRALPLEPR